MDSPGSPLNLRNLAAEYGEFRQGSERSERDRKLDGGVYVADTDQIEGSCLCGAITWTFRGIPESATACNCSACRRYGTLWAYDYDNERIKVVGETGAYKRVKPSLEFHFCP